MRIIFDLPTYKAKIVQLHDRREKMLLDIRTNYRMDDDDPTLNHVLKQQKRRDTRSITGTRHRRHNAYNNHGHCCHFRGTLSPEIQNH